MLRQVSTWCVLLLMTALASDAVRWLHVHVDHADHLPALAEHESHAHVCGSAHQTRDHDHDQRTPQPAPQHDECPTCLIIAGLGWVVVHFPALHAVHERSDEILPAAHESVVVASRHSPHAGRAPPVLA